MSILSIFSEVTKKSFFVFLLLLFIGAALYANILNAPFVYDDHGLLLEEPSVIGTSPLSDIWKNHRQKSVTFLTFAVNYRFGQDDPLLYHIVNIFIHVFTAYFLYCAILLLFSSRVLSESDLFKEKELFALFVSLVFLAHPLQTQSVTYIWQRSECLSGLFYLASYLLYINGRLKGKIYCYVFAAILFFVGFFVKGIIISLPVMVLLTEISFFNTAKSKKILKRFWPLLLLFIVLGSLAFLPFRIAQNAARKAHGLFMICTGLQLSKKYFYTQFQVILQYIRLAFIPIDQNLDYYIPFRLNFFNLPTVVSFAAVVSIWIGAMSLFKKHRLMAFGIFWFFIGLLPTTFVLRDVMWEHRVYLSMAGFSIFLISLLFTAITNRRARNISVICVICILSALTVSRNSFWRSYEVLLKDTIRKSSRLARPHLSLGMLYLKEGKMKSAFDLFKKAVELYPNHPQAHNNLGLVYLSMGDIERAEKAFKKAIGCRHGFGQAYINLARIEISRKNYQKAEELLQRDWGRKMRDRAFIAFGELYLAQQDFEKAETYFRKGLELNPKSPRAYWGLGDRYLKQNLFDKAIIMYEKAIELNPSRPRSYVNLGMAYRKIGAYDKAVDVYIKALSLDTVSPRSRAQILINIGAVYGFKGNYEEEIKRCLQSLSINPNNPQAYSNLSNAYRLLNNYPQALEYGHKAMKIDPDFVEGINNLGITYASVGQYKEAIVLFKRALKIDPDYNKAKENLSLAEDMLNSVP